MSTDNKDTSSNLKDQLSNNETDNSISKQDITIDNNTNLKDQSNNDETKAESVSASEKELNSVIIDDEPESNIINDRETDTDLKETKQDNKEIIEEIENNVTRKQQKIIIEYDIDSNIKITTDDKNNFITLPSNFDKETKDVLDKVPNINLLDNQESREWAQTVAEGLQYTTINEAFVPTLEDDEAEFKHKLEHNKLNLTAQAPKFKSAQNQNLKGERAIIRLISHLGLGTLFQTPLWHSGIWVTFKPPSDSEIIEINRLLTNDKIQLGRYTYGLIFSNTTAYTVDRLVNYALEHVYDISTKSEDINIDNLKYHIVTQDLPSFLWGFICTMYPKGFNYKRGCIADPEKCNHVIEETLNVAKLQWTNLKALTDWQKTFMSSRQSKTKDLEGVNRYKEELSKIQKKKIDITSSTGEEISITIKSPNLVEYIDSGHRWINSIVDIVDKALGSTANVDERNKLVTKYGQASAMKQYSHWIETIEYDTNIIDDRETIENTLDVLSSDDEVRVRFTDKVMEYINNSTISVIGIPVYDCPNCSKSQDTDHKLTDYKNIIPLDIIQLFFSLLTLRLRKIMER